MLAADIRLAYVAAVPAWLMRQAYQVFVFVWRWFWLLFGGTGVGDFPRLLQKMILVLAFSTDIKWGWVPKNSQPPGVVNTKNYQNDFFKGVNMENVIQIPYTPRPAWAFQSTLPRGSDLCIKKFKEA